jgi:PKD repeat protein
MIAVTHSSWADPFFAVNDDIYVNRLSTWEYEFKSVTLGTDYSWDFGDGTELDNGYEVLHTYSAPGEVTIRVIVQTESGQHNGEITITVDGVTPFEAPAMEEEPEAA